MELYSSNGRDLLAVFKEPTGHVVFLILFWGRAYKEVLQEEDVSFTSKWVIFLKHHCWRKGKLAGDVIELHENLLTTYDR